MATMVLVREIVPVLFRMPPPSKLAVLLLMVTLVRVDVPWLSMPPPWGPIAVLPLTVELMRVNVPLAQTPPPTPIDVLPLMVVSVRDCHEIISSIEQRNAG